MDYWVSFQFGVTLLRRLFIFTGTSGTGTSGTGTGGTGKGISIHLITFDGACNVRCHPFLKQTITSDIPVLQSIVSQRGS